MLRSVKNRIHNVLDRAGYSVSKKVAQAYEELIGIPRYQEQTVRLNGADFKIADALSFRHSYVEIFEKEIYRFPCSHSQPRIIDCGSNYGTSVVYFKSLYPDAFVTAVECDPAIFEILVWNIKQRGLENVLTLNKAVSNTQGPLKFFPEGADSGRLISCGESRMSIEVEALSLDSLLTEPVDFLKIDIEGEETSVLCGSQSLDRVQNLFVEFHSFVGCAQQLDILLEKLSSCGFRYFIQTQFCPTMPLMATEDYLGMDLQLNIFARRENELGSPF